MPDLVSSNAVLIDVPPFLVTELTGKGRQVQLVGWAAPQRPYVLEGTQRAEFTWYPGSPVATVQVLGAAEQTATVHGRWVDRYLGDLSGNPIVGGLSSSSSAFAQVDGKPVLTAAELVRTIDDVRRSGQLLEVQWSDIVRHGLLTTFKQNWQNVREVEWEMTFSWISQGDEAQLVLTREVDLSDVAQKHRQLVEDTTDSLASLHGVFSLASPDFTGLLDTVADARRTVRHLEAAVASTTQNPLQPVAGTAYGTASTLVGLNGTVRSLVEDGVSSAALWLGASTASNQTPLTPLQPPGTPPQVASFGQTVLVQKRARELSRRARLHRHQAARDRAVLQRQAQAAAVATVIVQAGQDLREIARQQYGDSDDWRAIAAYNGFSTSSVPAGTTVLIPAAVTRS
jgi:hypothetical protein